MNRIDEIEENVGHCGHANTMIVDQFSSVRPPPEDSNHHSSNNNICSSKQTCDETDPPKYQTPNRSISLPARQSFSSNQNTVRTVRQRRTCSVSANNKHKSRTTSLVTSFLQHLRSELRAATNENVNYNQRNQKEESSENFHYVLPTAILSNNNSHQHNTTSMPLSPSSSSTSVGSIRVDLNNLSDEDLLKANPFNYNHINDETEISTLINLLILRIETLNNEATVNEENNIQTKSPCVQKIDQNLIDYLYYLFNKFINEDSDSVTPIIDKSNFVNICHTLARHSSSSSMPSSSLPEQSSLETTESNNCDLTSIETLVREYRTDTDEITLTESSINSVTPRITLNDQDTWLIVDLERRDPQASTPISDELKCLLPSSTPDDQLLQTNDNYFSFEEIKSCESESSQSNYYSPDSSLVDIQNMSQDIDELNIINSRNVLLNEEGSSSPNEHTSNNAISILEAKDTASNNNICTGLTNDLSTTNNNNEQVALQSSSTSSMDTVEQMTISPNGKTSRREQKMQERWTKTTKINKNSTEPAPAKTFLGVEFPPIAVLRRKFSASPPSKANTAPLKRKENSSTKTNDTLVKNEENHSLSKIRKNSTECIPPTSINHSMSLETQEISTSSLPINDVNKSPNDQVHDPQTNDTSSRQISADDKTNDTVQQSSTIVSDLLTAEHNIPHEDTNIEEMQDQSKSPSNDTPTNIDNSFDQHEQTNINNNNDSLITSNVVCSNSLSPSSPLLISPVVTTTATEDKTIELLPTEIEKEKKEEHCSEYNMHVEEKNNSGVVEHNHHAPGIKLINDEPTQAMLLEQEKKVKEEEQEQEKERPSPSLPTLEQSNLQLFEDDSVVVQTSSSNLEKLIMTDVDENQQLYKTIELEEIPDEEEALSVQNNNSIEPTDYILTDDEPKISRQPKSKSKPMTSTTNDTPMNFEPPLSSYEQVMSKVAEKVDETFQSSSLPPKDSLTLNSTVKTNSHLDDDPIALRALQRFEQRMNAAMAAKVNHNENSSTSTRGKSSWSGTTTGTRKSLENVFNDDEVVTSLNGTCTNQQSATTTTATAAAATVGRSSIRDTFIRPRKTIFDDLGIHLGMKQNSSNTVQTTATTINNEDHPKREEEQEQQPQQQQLPDLPQPLTSPSTIENVEKEVARDDSIKLTDSEDHQLQQQKAETEEKQEEQSPAMIITTSMTNETTCNNELESSQPVTNGLHEQTANTAISRSSSSSDQQAFTPYHLHLEGRRRLNTLERVRSRQPSQDITSQLQNKYTIKPEEIQDPIIRRALERFDEKSRSLTQTRTNNYDDIQDPITRRALMRLDSNLKRTMPSTSATALTSTNNDAVSDSWYTNSYTLGSLNSGNDHRQLRYPDATLPTASFTKPAHVSVHQRCCSTSASDMPESSANNLLSDNDHDIPIMRVPTQPIYVTSTNQPPVSLRQRSHSEDMLSSREVCLNEINTTDDTNHMQLQRNYSSNALQTVASSQVNGDEQLIEDSSVADEIDSSVTPDFPLSTTLIKSLEPNFVRTTESAVNYVTPTQTYSAYSCEYTRPHQNQNGTSSKPDLTSPRNLQQQQLQQAPQQQIINENCGAPYTPPSAFTPVNPLTNNYHHQQSAPATSYQSMYPTNNLNQTPYSDDPIVRRALERFNSHIQHSLMGMPQYNQTTNNMPYPISNGYSRLGSFDSFYPPDPHHGESWSNSNRPTAPTSATSTGYQSIIGRRRQLRQDDNYHDNISVGNGYSSFLFNNFQNEYQQQNHTYMNFPDEPPAIPPRSHRDQFREQPEFLCENVNNNNNNIDINGYTHPAYPPMPNGFRPINHQYMQSELFHNQYPDEDYLRNRAQSTSSTTSSDSVNPVRLTKQRLPPQTFTRTNVPQNKKSSPEDNLQIPSGQTTPSNGSTQGESVFQRLAYANTKSSLSKSSSNLCANLLNKNSQQQQHAPQQNQQQPLQNKSSNLKTYDIDFEDSNNVPVKQPSVPISTNLANKCQRSRSVDGRARLKNAQTRLIANNANRSINDSDDNSSTPVPSSKFTAVHPRRDPPPRIPVTPRSNITDRPSLTKRVASGNNLSYIKHQNGNRTRTSNANLLDTENDDVSTSQDNGQPKIIENKPRSSIPVHRYSTTNNNTIQSSASTSSVNSTMSRTRVPIPTAMNLDKKDVNASGTDLSRLPKRSDESRVVSPSGQRRHIPVSVFSPAKHDNKRPAPIPPTSNSPQNNDSNTVQNGESHPEPLEQPISYSPRPQSSENMYANINHNHEITNKLSTMNSNLKASTGNILDEFSVANDKHDNNKKMNVFERLFRGYKKKV